MGIKQEFRIPSKVLIAISDAKGLWHGGTVSVDHEDCPAGTDRRQRLYVTMDSNGTLLGYCHNCGSRGVWFNKDTSNIHDRIVVHSIHKKFEPPQIWDDSHPLPYKSGFGPIPDFSEFFEKWQIPIKLAFEDGWRYQYDNETQAMVLLFPCYDKEGELCGVQKRHIMPKEELEKKGIPKIKTYGHATAHLFNPNDADTCVIVEDRVSSVRVVEAGYAAMCMHGAKIVKAVEASQLATLFERIVVWLDNDSDAVAEIAHQSSKNLAMFTSNCARVYYTREPKYHDKSSIQRLIGAAT